MADITPISGWRRPSVLGEYPGGAVMATFAGSEGRAGVVEYAIRRYRAVAEDGREEDCGHDLRRACSIARQWAGQEETL